MIRDPLRLILKVCRVLCIPGSPSGVSGWDPRYSRVSLFCSGNQHWFIFLLRSSWIAVILMLLLFTNLVIGPVRETDIIKFGVKIVITCNELK